MPGDGLNYYPQAGDTIEFYHKSAGGGDEYYFYFKWALQTGSVGFNNESDGYGLFKHKDGSTWELRNFNTGRITRGSYDFNEGEWHRFQIDWGTDGTIQVTIWDSSGTQRLSFSGTDSDYTGGGIGFEVNPVPGSASMNGQWDTVTANPGGSGGTGVSGLVWETTADWDAAVSESGVVHEAVENTDHVDAGVVKQGYSIEDPFLSANLVGYWPLQEDTGTTAFDFSGNQNDGSVTGASKGSGGLLGTSAYSFAGSDDNVVSGSRFDPWADGECSISAWENGDSLNTSGASEYVAGHAPDTDHNLYVYNQAGFWGSFLQVDGTNDIVNGTSITNGDWYHLVSIVDPTTHFFYQNGTLQGTSDHGLSPSNIGPGHLYIGQRGSDGVSKKRPDAQIAEVRIYDRALSAAEVKVLYNVIASPGSITTASKEA